MTLSVPGFGFAVPVVLDPDCEHLGVVEQGYDRPVVKLREWNQRVLLHETLHVLLMAWRFAHRHPEPCACTVVHERVSLSPYLIAGTPEEEALVRHLTGLFELGWRLPDAG